jgi:hypothetical protein
VAVTVTRSEFACNFYLWGNFKQKVCRSGSHILEALEIEIRNVIMEIIRMQLNVKSTIVCLHNETPLSGGICRSAFITLAPNMVIGQLYTLMTLHQGKEPPVYVEQGAEWVPRSGLYVLKKGTVFVTCWELNPQFLSCPLCQLKCSGF